MCKGLVVDVTAECKTLAEAGASCARKIVAMPVRPSWIIFRASDSFGEWSSFIPALGDGGLARHIQDELQAHDFAVRNIILEDRIRGDRVELEIWAKEQWPAVEILNLEIVRHRGYWFLYSL